MIIAHNMMAINAQRQYNIVGKSKSKTTEKLSSGYRVNRAADDAAGLAISEKMRRQIRGLTQASANIQDGISYVQVADGALEEVHEILHRITELSIKSANGTNSDEDRRYLDQETQHLKGEINRILGETSFNQQKIWDEQLIPISTTIVEKDVTDTYPAVVFKAGEVSSYTNNMNKGAMPRTNIDISATDSGIKVAWTGYNGTKYESNEIPWPTELRGTHSFQLSDYMDYTKYPDAVGVDFTYKYTVDKYSTKEQVVAAFNKGTADLSTYISNGVDTKNSFVTDSQPKIISSYANIDYDAMLASGKDFNAYDTGFIEFVSMNNPALSSVDDDSKFSFKFNMPGIGSVTASFTDGYYYGNYNSNLSDRTGENVWWKEYKSSKGERWKSTIAYGIGGSLNEVLKSVTNTDGHSLWSNNTSGGSVNMYFSLTADSPYTRADGTKTSNVGSMSLYFSVNKSNASTQEELVDYITRGLANYSGTDISDDDASYQGYARIYRYSDDESSVLASNTYTVKYKEHEYLHSDMRDIYIQAGSEAGEGIHIRYENMNTELLGMDSVNLLTIEDSKKALGMVERAMEKVSDQRSLFGAYQNRLEHARKNDDNIVENTTAAESLIRDTDMAKEMVELSMKNILEQVGQSMMAQANQSVQGVMSLLQ